MSGPFDYQTDNFHEAETYHHPYSQNERPTKLEKPECNLPSINEVLNESTGKIQPFNEFRPEIYQTDTYNWEAHDYYKEFSPPHLSSNVYAPSYIFDSGNLVTKVEDANGLPTWCLPQVQSDFSLNESQQQILPMPNQLLYEQATFSMFQVPSNSHQYYQLAQQELIADYQPQYTHSPPTCTDQQIINTIAINSNGDMGEFDEFFIESSGNFDMSSSTSTSARVKTENPISSTNQKFHTSNSRINKHGKIIKKATQNCHANSRCSNCNTTDTTLWRRNSFGEVECNACNLYFRKNQTRRPTKLQRRGIMRRSRNPRHPCSNDQSPETLYVQVSP